MLLISDAEIGQRYSYWLLAGPLGFDSRQRTIFLFYGNHVVSYRMGTWIPSGGGGVKAAES